MECDHCVASVKKAVEEAGGKNVKVSLKDKTASFDFDPAVVTLEKISQAIEEQGFEVKQ
jgi:copper chaperone